MLFLYYAALFVFLLTNQSLYIFGGDSAEFSLVGRTFSIAHPPGYPFYSFLANLVNLLLPVSTTPWRVAILSTLSTIIASFFIYKLLRMFKVNLYSALLAATLYIFLFPVWLYSEIPEVFALSNALVITITYLLFSYLKKKSMKLLFIISFLVGISISHHHIFILFFPAWIYLVYTEKKQFLNAVKGRRLYYLAAAVFSGAAFYLYAVIASIFNPPLDWENAQTLNGLIRLVTRSTYGTFKAYAGSTGNVLNQLFDIFSFFIFLLHDFRIIGLVMIVIGLFSLRTKMRDLKFVAILLATHLFFLFYTNFVLFGSFTLAMYERFLIPIYLILLIPFAFGVDESIRLFRKLIAKGIKNAALLQVGSASIYFFLTAYFAIIFIQNYQVIKRVRSMDYFAVYAKNLLDTVPTGAIFFVGADNSHFTSAYYRYAQNYRTDVKFIFLNILDKEHYRKKIAAQYPSLYVPKNYAKGGDLVDFIKKNSSQGIYFENPLGVSTWKPYGLLWKYYPSEVQAASDSANLVRENAYLWEHVYRIPDLDNEDKKILHLNVVQDHYLEAYINFSKLLFVTNNVTRAEDILKKILEQYRRNDTKNTVILANLLVYQEKCAEAKKYLNRLSVKDIYQDIQFAPSLKEYYDMCEKDSPYRGKIEEVIKRSKKEQKSLLKEF